MKQFSNFSDAIAWIGKLQERAKQLVIPIIAEQVYKDSEKYTYEDTKTMYRSGAIYSQFDKGYVILRTPYAKVRYYEGGKAGDGNRQAIPMWFEQTKKDNMKTYKNQYAKVFNKGG